MKLTVEFTPDSETERDWVANFLRSLVGHAVKATVTVPENPPAAGGNPPDIFVPIGQDAGGAPPDDLVE